jgi:hypothetical protein
LKSVAEGASPQIPKSNAVPVWEAVKLLRHWRKSFPLTTRLDGKDSKKSNPQRWLHIIVEGYSDDHAFASRYGPLFTGQQYDGVVNFHGDTTSAAIDRFIDLLDQVDDYHAILRPSATYETTTKPQNRKVRPKFALQGYEEIEGFFLYHDDSMGTPHSELFEAQTIDNTRQRS